MPRRLRYATTPIETLVRINDLVRTSIEKYLTSSVEEVLLNTQEFDEMFARFKRDDAA